MRARVCVCMKTVEQIFKAAKCCFAGWCIPNQVCKQQYIRMFTSLACVQQHRKNQKNPNTATIQFRKVMRHEPNDRSITITITATTTRCKTISIVRRIQYAWATDKITKSKAIVYGFGHLKSQKPKDLHKLILLDATPLSLFPAFLSMSTEVDANADAPTFKKLAALVLTPAIAVKLFIYFHCFVGLKLPTERQPLRFNRCWHTQTPVGTHMLSMVSFI